MPGNASNLNNGTTHSNVDNSNASGSHYSVLSTNGDVVKIKLIRNQSVPSTTVSNTNNYPDQTQVVPQFVDSSINQITNGPTFTVPSSTTSIPNIPTNGTGTQGNFPYSWHTPHHYGFPSSSTSLPAATYNLDRFNYVSTLGQTMHALPAPSNITSGATSLINNSSLPLNPVPSSSGSTNFNGFMINGFNNRPFDLYSGNNQAGLPMTGPVTGIMGAPNPDTNIVPRRKVTKRINNDNADVNPKKSRGRPKKPTSNASDSLSAALDKKAAAALAVTADLNTVLAMIGHPPVKGRKKRAKSTATSTTTALSAMSTMVSAIPTALSSASTASTSFYSPPKNFGVSSNPRPTVTAKVPIPPNWLENCEDTIMSLYTYRKYVLSPETQEYQTIINMLHPIQVTGIEQIVNPDLWKRFDSTRKDMLRSKTDDLEILSKLGLDEREVLRCTHLALNYTKDPLVIPYSDNMVLLFHCTRIQTNLNNILSQGLDERLSNISGGLLGKGIYFADDPNKSIQYDGTGYILIFAVLLGDCISVDHFQNRNSLVREPEKVAQQKRNFNDQFFDSIVARPAGYNEYVIYNRYQCCPIYQIKYDRSVSSMIGGTTLSNLSFATQKLPPIAWIPKGSNYAMPIQDQTTDWPFFAVDVFTAMGVTPPTDEDLSYENLNNEYTENNSQQMSINDNLASLIGLGFNDEDKNKEILNRFNNDLQQTVNYLLDNDSVVDAVEENNQPSTSTTINTSTLFDLQNIVSTSKISMPSTSKERSRRQSIVTIDLIDDESESSDDEKTVSYSTATTNDAKPCEIKSEMDLPEDIAEWALEYDPNNFQKEMEDCPICCNDFESYETSTSSWQLLQCSHKVCLSCYAKLLTSRYTMSGIQHTFVKCPFCQGTTGTEVGTCPDMQMGVSISTTSCETYEPTSTININYTGQNFNRHAFLPNNAEGQEVLRLLKIAFDRRLCFTVGTSATTGQQNVVVWNIHHKTSIRGGVSSYGWPDPGYVERVKWELKAFGIE